DFLNHRLQKGPRRFHQLPPYFLEQVPALFGGERLDKLLRGRGQNALETDEKQITDQVGMDVLRTAAHVILLELAHPLANGGFDFSLRLHAELQRVQRSDGRPNRSRANQDKLRDAEIYTRIGLLYRA